MTSSPKCIFESQTQKYVRHRNKRNTYKCRLQKRVRGNRCDREALQAESLKRHFEHNSCKRSFIVQNDCGCLNVGISVRNRKRDIALSSEEECDVNFYRNSQQGHFFEITVRQALGRLRVRVLIQAPNGDITLSSTQLKLAIFQSQALSPKTKKKIKTGHSAY